ncbi:SGT1 protein-domain-containing protein [Polychytrium aggregatum]|uniref:SGT1 protein-domain-containing protein n=1 Tax=Polychytrium aggregatum TaxID=110093 RepID=UPI0022FEE286|nr:SGT1 protein-domain-containing protein [Polychytrium aggregatum]KAI9209446.1 SGT1 protein-domain-containing protein [Polychytrium aggregatum]
MDSAVQGTPEEDAVVYTIYDLGALRSPYEPGALDRLSSSLLSDACLITEGYIWHKDRFNLAVSVSGSEMPSLSGRQRIGDCIDDEWFVVYVLLELSKKYPDIAVRVQDTDGEFLLIEAAMELPSWLDPTTSPNRTYIHRGKLHIVPRIHSHGLGGDISLRAGLAAVADEQIQTQASVLVDKAISARTQRYPAKAARNTHHASCIVPLKVAHLLYHEPQLVSAAVEAFYLRDPISLKACHKMETFPPATNVRMTIKFSRLLYAQLLSQQFYPPKPFQLPASSDPSFKAADLGMKLACGLEMICADRTMWTPEDDKATVCNYPFEQDKEWAAFQSRLIKMGYYRTEIAGSKLFKHLEQTAKEQYLLSKGNDLENIDNPASRIRYLLSLPQVERSQLPNGPEDSDAWMYIEDTELDDVFQQRAQENVRPEEALEALNDDDESSSDGSDSDDEKINSADVKKLETLIQSFGKFMKTKSDPSGALFPHETTDHEAGVPIHFDESEFFKSVVSILGDPDEATAESDQDARPTAPLKKRQARQIIVERDSDDEDDSDEEQEDEDLHSDPALAASIDAEMKQYMESMDHELHQTKLGKDFEKQATTVVEADANDQLSGSADDEEEFRPVDLDVNLIKNLLMSFESQQGLSGPGGSILSSLGITLPKNKDT